MGQVYRARDTRLGRDVAIKTAKQQFSERFEREARAIAALNHPNICTLFDVGPNYLVMELVDGPTLGERIKDDVILFANRAANPGIWKVSAAGGTPVFVAKTDSKRNEVFHAFPAFLPDGKHFIYRMNSSDADKRGVYVGSLDSKPAEQSKQRLIATQLSPAYAHSDEPGKSRLLFLRDRTLMAQPFDAASLKLSGDPAPVAASRIGIFGSSGYFSVSANGPLVYRAGEGGRAQLTWFDRVGKNLGPVKPAAMAAWPSLRMAGARPSRTRRMAIPCLAFGLGAQGKNPPDFRSRHRCRAGVVPRRQSRPLCGYRGYRDS